MIRVFVKECCLWLCVVGVSMPTLGEAIEYYTECVENVIQDMSCFPRKYHPVLESGGAQRKGGAKEAEA